MLQVVVGDQDGVVICFGVKKGEAVVSGALLGRQLFQKTDALLAGYSEVRVFLKCTSGKYLLTLYKFKIIAFIVQENVYSEITCTLNFFPN